MTTKEKFIEMAKNITRPGIDEMMAWLETTDFYDAPASTRFHGSQAGGLCAHSITVAKRLVELANLYVPGKYTMDALMTVALFHDVCKIATYQVEMRNRKNSAGMWEQVPFYQFAPKESVGGDNHGSLSCQRIMEHGIRLTQEEYGAVNKTTWASRILLILAVSGSAMRCIRCPGFCTWRMRRQLSSTKSDTSQKPSLNHWGWL